MLHTKRFYGGYLNQRQLKRLGFTWPIFGHKRYDLLFYPGHGVFNLDLVNGDTPFFGIRILLCHTNTNVMVREIC